MDKEVEMEEDFVNGGKFGFPGKILGVLIVMEKYAKVKKVLFFDFCFNFTINLTDFLIR